MSRAIVVTWACAVPALAQDRGARGAEKGEPAPVVRVVHANGDQSVGAELAFRWTDFAPLSADDGALARGARGGEGGRGGRAGERGGRGELGDALTAGRAFASIATFAQVVALDRTRDLGKLDRVEVDGALVFQAKPPARVLDRVTDRAYANGYGGLALDLPEGWTFVESTELAVVAIQRASDGDIVGRVRVSIHAPGDGIAARVPFDEAAAQAQAVLGAAYVDRFETIAGDTSEDAFQDDGTRVKRFVRRGLEKGSRAPLHLEGNLLLDGPFVPLVELLARGDARDEVLAQARRALASVRIDRTKPAPSTSQPLAPAAPAPRGGEDGGEGRARGGGRDPAALMQQWIDAVAPGLDMKCVVDGAYANAEIGVRSKDALPDEMFFTRADAHGFTAFRRTQERKFVDASAVGATVLWGEPRVKNPIQWLADRYARGFLGADAKDGKPPRAKPATLGKTRTQHLELQRGMPLAGETSLDVWFVEDSGRIVVFTATAVGSSGDRKRALEVIEKWLRTIEIAKPAG